MNVYHLFDHSISQDHFDGGFHDGIILGKACGAYFAAYKCRLSLAEDLSNLNALKNLFVERIPTRKLPREVILNELATIHGNVAEQLRAELSALFSDMESAFRLYYTCKE